jgi:serine/threonine-protein kinase
VDKRLGRYDLRKPIGRGAAGTVWDGWDSLLNRRVAVKVVRSGDRDEQEIAEMLQRFRQEAQLASRLSHPGVVQVYDYGEADGEAYIVMEFVEGETLKALLDRREKLPLHRIAAIISGVLAPLDVCHKQAIVHRDIKPSNIMLPQDGGVKLADFGISRMDNSELTIVGTVMGTPAYMSPEQFTAREPVDVQSDIWSVGVVLYEMLTGVRPFSGATMTAVGQAVVNDPFEPASRLVPDLPAALDVLLQRALRKAPAERFPNAQAFLAALQSAIPSVPPPVTRRRSSRGRALVLAGLGAALVAGGGAAWLAFRGPEPAAPPAVVVAPPAEPMPLRVAALPCSSVTVTNEGGVTSFQGVIGSGAPRAALDEIVARVPAASVSVQTFPYADLSCRMAELVRRYAGEAGARLTATGGRTTLRANDEIRLRLIMPNFEGEVRLEDLNSDGSVGHLMEANLGAPPRHPPGAMIGLGRNGNDLIGRASPPYGSDMLVAIVSSQPLFAGGRPIEEAGGPFIAALDAAMAALRQRGGLVAADALVLTTAAR